MSDVQEDRPVAPNPVPGPQAPPPDLQAAYEAQQPAAPQTPTEPAPAVPGATQAASGDPGATSRDQRLANQGIPQVEAMDAEANEKTFSWTFREGGPVFEFYTELPGITLLRLAKASRPGANEIEQMSEIVDFFDVAVRQDQRAELSYYLTRTRPPLDINEIGDNVAKLIERYGGRPT